MTNDRTKTPYGLLKDKLQAVEDDNFKMLDFIEKITQVGNDDSGHCLICGHCSCSEYCPVDYAKGLLKELNNVEFHN